MALGLLPAVAAPASAVPRVVSPAAVSTGSTPSDTAAVAVANGHSEAQIKQILADPAARVGAGSRLYYVDPPPAALADAAAPQPTALFPYAQTFRLHSRPGSSKVIYLDFDGHTVTGAGWSGYAGVPSFEAQGFSLDGSPAFSNGEQDVVQSVWQRVAEDYAVFDVDVTTEDPGPAAITRVGLEDQLYGTRVLITDTRTIADLCGCGGIAYVGVFDEPDSHATYQPAFVFSRSFYGNAKYLAEAVSHEAGHNLSLLHDGTSSTGYYAGHGAWVPTMGVSYYKPISQWSKGEYPGANNPEDDLARIQATGPVAVADDHGDTAGAATVLDGGPTAGAAGLVSTDEDVDVFRVTTPAGSAAFSVAPASPGPNLDVRLEVRTADGTLLASDDPPSAYVSYDGASGLGASVSLPLDSGGDRYLFVSGVGAGSAATGYSGYGSLGRYTLTTTVNQPMVSLISSSNPADLGQPVTFTAAVTAPPGSGVPTGTVTFLDGGTTVCGAVLLDGDQATCAAALGANGHSITAAYSGDATHAAATSAALAQVVNGELATVAVTSSTNPSLSGDPATFQATVAPGTPDTGPPAGTVTFTTGFADLCTDVPLSAGQATCAASMTTGSYLVTAVYGGDDRFNAATSPALSQTVVKKAATVTVSTSSNPSVWGNYLTLTASVSAAAPATGRPTGTVSFADGPSVVCSGRALAGGSATCSLTLAVGTHSLTAVYGGDPSFTGATSPAMTQTVDRGLVVVVVSSSSNPSASGQTVLLQAQVFPQPYWAGSPTGTVTFLDGPSVLCADVVVSAGSASCSRSFTAGDHPLTAVYSGGSLFAGSTSSLMTQQVGRAAVTVVVGSSANPVASGAALTLTATVVPVEAGTGTPTGTVTFDGPTMLCGPVPLTGTEAACTVTLTPGIRSITATFNGDDGFSPATSLPLTQRVLGEPATVVVSSSVNPSVSGQAVTFRADVAPQVPGGGTPTGVVTFSDGGAVLCAGVVLSAAAATCVASPPAGSRAVTAAYGGDGRFDGATSPAFEQTIGPAGTVLGMASSANPLRVGESLMLTATVTALAPGTGTPAGAVSFMEGGATLCPAVPLASGRATCSPSLAAGSHRITATYLASTELLASTGVLDQVVVPSGDTFVPVVPTRLHDTRFGIGSPPGAFGPNTTRDLVVRGGTTPVPDAASAVVLNVTVTGPTSTSYLKVSPAGALSFPSSNLTFVAGQTIPNLVMTGVGPGGRISVFNFLGSVHVIIDVVGYYVPAGGATFTAVTPGRLLDTRAGTPVGPGATRDLVVRGGTTGVPADATAVVLNTTATRPSVASYLTVSPTGAPRPIASNLNYVAGQTIPNLVVVGVGAGDRISIFNAFGTVDVLVDVVGYYAPTGGSRFVALAPRRVLDTRDGTGGPAVPLGPRATRDLVVRGGATAVPDTATAVVLNVTVVFPTAASYLTVYPSGVARPTASNLNFVTSQIIPNLVVTGVGTDGRISIYNDAGGVHVIGDIVGYMI